jgi:hypothetical protein
MPRRNAFGNLSENNLLLLGILAVLVVVYFLFFWGNKSSLSSSSSNNSKFITNFTTMKNNITKYSANMNLPVLPSDLLTKFISSVTTSMSSLTAPGMSVYTTLVNQGLSSSNSYAHLKNAKLFNSSTAITTKYKGATLTLKYNSKADYDTAYTKFTNYYSYIFDGVSIDIPPVFQKLYKLPPSYTVNVYNVAGLTNIIILPFFYGIVADTPNNSIYFFNLNTIMPTVIGPITGLAIQLATVYLFATVDHKNYIDYGIKVLNDDLSV